MAFVLTAILLFVYDKLVTRRQDKTMDSALKTSALVVSLFPENVLDRVLEDAVTPNTGEALAADDEGNHYSIEKSGKVLMARPIADFFPDSTIMFADIAGFTGWSSTRGTQNGLSNVRRTIYSRSLCVCSFFLI
jgi:hypothetical protein